MFDTIVKTNLVLSIYVSQYPPHATKQTYEAIWKTFWASLVSSDVHSNQND